jgi:hypothetical protein
MTEAPVDALDALLKLEAARLSRPLGGVDATVFAHERAVVMAESTLKGGLYTEDLPRLVPGLVATVAGGLLSPESATSTGAIALTDVQRATSAWKPWTTTIYLTGDFDAGEVIGRLQTLWPQDLLFRDKSGALPAEGTCPRRAVKRAFQAPAARSPGRPPVVRYPVDHPWLLYGWILPNGFTGADPLRELAARRMASELWEVRAAQSEDEGPGCVYLPGMVMSSVVCSVPLLSGVSPDALDKKVRAALAWAPSQASDPSFQYWVRGYAVAARLDTEWALSELSPLRGQDAMVDALVAHFTTEPNWYTDVLTTYPSLTAEGLDKLMREWIRPDQALPSLVVAPGTDLTALYARAPQPDVSEGGVEEGEARAPSAGSHHDNLLGAEADATLKVPALRLDAPVAGKLVTGLDVVAVSHGSDGRVRVGLHLPMGPTWTTSPAGLDEWLRWMTGVNVETWPIRESPVGAVTANGLQNGARWWTDVDEDSYARGLRGSTGNLEQMLWLLRTWVDSLVVLQPTAGSTQSVQTWLAGLDGGGWGAAYSWQLGQLLGASHPLARPASARILEASKVGYGTLQKRLNEVWRPDKARLVIVGDVEAAYAQQLGQYMFSTWAAKGSAPTWSATPAAPQASGAVRRSFTDPDRGSTTVSLVCRVDSAAAPVVAVTEHVLAKAMQRGFRDSELAAYDPSAVIERAGPGLQLTLSATVRPADAEAAMAKLEALVTWATTTGPSASNVADSGRQRARQVAMSAVHTDDVYAWTARHGGEVQRVLTGWGALAASTQPAQVKAMVTPCANAMAITSVGP